MLCFKCDACGKLFNTVDLQKKDVVEVLSSTRDEGGYPVTIHVCRSCADKLMDWCHREQRDNRAGEPES